jgi:hypothetical protein
MSLLSVAPNSLTGMVTIPKLIEPLQIALGMHSSEKPAGRSTGAFPHSAGVVHRNVNINRR